MKKFAMMSSTLALMVGIHGAAEAQDAPAAASDTDAGGIGDIVVTARRQSENMRDIPDSIQAFGGDTMEQAGVTSVNDLSSVGLRVSTSWKRSSPASR